MSAAFRKFSAVAVLLLVAASAFGQTHLRALRQEQSSGRIPPLLDDAGLHDVQFVGPRHGWAVGDRGVIWSTDDGGETWRLCPSGVDCSLKTVCFLSDRVGWAAGGGVVPRVDQTHGVVIGTRDGGETWQVLADELPLLLNVQFFDLERGFGVCVPTVRYPSGVIETRDGGRTWSALRGETRGDWQVGAFASDEIGFVAGRLGRFTNVAAGKVWPPLNAASTLRGIAAATISPGGQAWMAGDGGLILRSSDGGASWQPPTGDLSGPVRDVMDFRAIATHGDHTWLGGFPGSAVLHTPDKGQTWQSFATGCGGGISALHFASELRGCAVGTMGKILITEDGGRTWTPVRGQGRRLALLAFHAHESRVSANLLTKYGAEEGYRTAVHLLVRRDIGPDGAAGHLLDRRLQDAVVEAGGSAACVDWAFPVTAPGLDHDMNALVREWQLLTDNRLKEVMLARLVTQIRAWQPDVVVVDTAPENDMSTRLMVDALQLAVSRAADPDYADAAAVLHLPPWTVKRAYRRLPPGSAGDVMIDSYEFLPRLGASVSMASADAAAVLAAPLVTDGTGEAYRLWPVGDRARESAGRHFFAGLVLRPGGDARRELLPLKHSDLERRQSLADHQRNFAAYIQDHLRDERHAAQLIAQLTDMIGAAPPDQAAVQLHRLAEEYRRRGQWEHAQMALFELVERFPEEPVSLAAMRWLFLFSSSAEVSWQRLRRHSTATRSELRTDALVVAANVQDAVRNSNQRESIRRLPGSDGEVRQATANTSLVFGGGAEQRQAKILQWQGQSERILQLLQRSHPTYFAEPEIQFPVAAFERSRSHPSEADRILAGFLGGSGSEHWTQIAAGEIWLTRPSTAAPGNVAVCRRAIKAPRLDGDLSDECWLQSPRLPLLSPSEHERLSHADLDASTEHSYIQLSYDGQFLYFAARMMRRKDVAAEPVDQPGRTHDGDLSGQDRLSILIDIDRDYATFYQIEVDQRGWSADACWTNTAWNAERYIAASDDADRWQLEMAVPLTELVPHAPRAGETWAIGLVRILPTVGIESWSAPAGTQPRPEGFGLLRFE